MWGTIQAELALAWPAPPCDPKGEGAGAGAFSTALRRNQWLLAVAGTLLAFGAGYGADLKPKLALAAVAGIAVVVLVVLEPLAGGLLLVAVVPVVSGLAPGFPVPYVRLSELLTGLVGTTLILTARRHRSLPWDALDGLLLAYCLAWAGFGVLDAHLLAEHVSLSLWGTVFGQLQFFLIYRGVRVSVRTIAERKLALATMLIAAVPVAALAVAQELHIGAIQGFVEQVTASAPPPPWAGLLRATGPFVNWAALAGYLFPLLLVMVSLALARQTWTHRRAFVAIAALATIALLLTAELSAIICLCIGLVWLGFRYGRGREFLRWLAICAATAAIVTGPFLSDRLTSELTVSAGSGRSSLIPQTIAFREQVWLGQYLPAIEARPLEGYGVVNPSSITWQYTESEYVSLAMQGGIPLLVLFGALTVVLVDRARRAGRSHDPFEAALGRALVVAAIGIVAMDLIWPYMSNGGMPQVLWCLAALALPRRPAARQRSEPLALAVI